MARQPESTDRFRIHAETTTDNVGNVLRALTIMGVSIAGCEMITDVPTFRKNNGKKHEQSSTELALAWVKDHPRFEVGEMAKYFAAEGRSTTHAYAIVKALTKSGALIKTGDKSYQAPSAVKALPAPAASRARAKRTAVPQYDVSNRDIILQWLADKDELTVADLGSHFEAQGRPKKSASPMLAKMGHDKLVASLGEGKYRVLAKGKREIIKLTQQHSNSGVETTHG